MNPLKKVEVSEGALAVAKGRFDRADSLRVLAEGIVVQQNEKINIYEKKIANIQEEVKLVKEQCELKSLNTNAKNKNLEVENKELRKSRNFWRTLAVGIPTVLSAAATYVILK